MSRWAGKNERITKRLHYRCELRFEVSIALSDLIRDL